MSKDHKTLPVLVVDLDGTLLRSDMLHETFWSAASRDWRNALSSIGKLAHGRLALKMFLADRAEVEVAALPYEQAVIDLILQHREAGGKTALVSATEQSHVRRIAKHLGLFDEAHGSHSQTNLKGLAKRTFLEHQYGDRGFIYVGDSKDDLEVWNGAKEIITVNASRSVKVRAERIGHPVQHITRSLNGADGLLRTLRPHQWLKNILIFVPILASHQFGVTAIAKGVMAFVGFCLIASSVYVLNDLLDLSSDRTHPRKRNRPFASGTLSPAMGIRILPILLVAGMTVALYTGWLFTLVMALYFILTCAYSFRLKRKIGADICALAILYAMRIVAGGVATGITISPWLFAFSLFFFFAMAAMKRQAELVDMARLDRLSAAGRGWIVQDLGVLNGAVLASGYLSVLVLALYVNSDQVQLLYSYPSALFGDCIIIFYWITRAEILTNRGKMHDDPIVFAMTDRVSHYCLISMTALTIGAATL